MKVTASHPQQTFLPFFSDLEIAVRQQSWKAEQQRKAKRIIRPHGIPVQLVDHDLDLLDLPLFKSGAIAEFLHNDPLNDDNDLIFARDKDLLAGESEEWSESAALQVHYILLERSLEYLAARGNPHEKLDVINWIFRPETPEEVIRQIDGKKERLLVPFTFGACCRLQGLDPDTLRDEIAMECRERGLPLH